MSGSRWSSRGSTPTGSEPAPRPGEGHLIVSPGRLVWEKGHYDVIRALATVAAEPRLLIVGAGPERTRLLRYADDLGLGDRVEVRPVAYDEMPASRRRIVRRSGQLADQDVGRAVRARSGRGSRRRSASRAPRARSPRFSRGRVLRSSALETGSGSRACSRPAARGTFGPARRLSGRGRPEVLDSGRRRKARVSAYDRVLAGYRGRGGRHFAAPAGGRREEVAVVGPASVRSSNDDDVKRKRRLDPPRACASRWTRARPGACSRRAGSWCWVTPQGPTGSSPGGRADRGHASGRTVR